MRAVIFLSGLILFSVNTFFFSNSFQDESRVTIKLKQQTFLSSDFNELNGLCYSDSGKFFTHSSSKGFVYQIDTSNGELVKSWQVGLVPIEGEFVDIEYVDENFFLIDRDGTIFEFKEGVDQRKVPFKVHQLGFSSRFSIGGFCYDEIENTFLITCENYPGKKYRGYRAIYSCSLNEFKVNPLPRYLISLYELYSEKGIKSFYPKEIIFTSSSDESTMVFSDYNNVFLILNNNGDVENSGFFAEQDINPKGVIAISDSTLLMGSFQDSVGFALNFINIKFSKE